MCSALYTNLYLAVQILYTFHIWHFVILYLMMIKFDISETLLFSTRIDKEVQVPMNKSPNSRGYSGREHDDVHCMIHEALQEHEEKRLGRHIDESWEEVVHAVF